MPIKNKHERVTLTVNEARVLVALIDYERTKGYQPSETELARLCELSTVHRQLKRLDEKGFITKTGVARSIQIAEDVWDEN